MTPPPGDLETYDEPLVDRLPRYLATFGTGLGLAGLGGLTWSVVGDATFAAGMGWALLLIGVVFLLSGGMSGGGFIGASSGDYGIFYGRRHQHGHASTEGEILRYQDLRSRLRHNLRPTRNPAAFWQVVAGVAYVAIGVFLLDGLG